MIDGLLRGFHLLARCLFIPCIGITVIQREVAAREMDPDLVTFLKHITVRKQFKAVLIDRPRHQQSRRLPDRLAESRTYDALRQIVCRSLRIYIDERGGKIRIFGGRGRMQHDHDWAGHFEVFEKFAARKHQHIMPGLIGPLIHRSGPD
jgi:hypothetical protein